MLTEIVWDRQTLGLVMIFSIPLAAILGGVWILVERQRAEADLKRSMIERGMSAEDIERIIAARPDGKSPAASAPPRS